jgi:hypothetical protein
MSLINDNITSEGILSGNTLYAEIAEITNLVVTNITGASTTDYYVTGGTYSSGTLTLNRNGLSDVTITGLNSGTVTGTGVTDKVAYWSDASGITFNNNFTWDSTNKRLGIGLTTPTEKLHVAGNVLITGTTFTSNLNVTGGTGINWISGSTSTDMLRVTQTGSGNAFVVEDDANPDATPFVITSIGNVGIGTSSPNEKLRVSGNTIVSGTISGSSLNLTTTPTLNNTNQQILTRNATSGNVEYSSPGSTAFYPYGIGFAQNIGNYLT